MNTYYNSKPLNVSGRSWNLYNLYSRAHYNENEASAYNQKKWATNKHNQSSKHLEKRGIWKVVENYLETSTLHGLKYVGDTSIPLGDRLFWLMLVLCALACATYFIFNIYEKYNINPVIITMNPVPIPVWDIPFPSVTICSMSLIRKSDAHILSINRNTLYQKVLDETCEFINPHLSTKTADNQAMDQDLLSFMSNLSRPCDELLAVCRWLDQSINCSRLFSPILTDMGLCCTFNQLPLEYILRDPQPLKNLHAVSDNYQQQEIDDWNAEQGYSADATYEVYPFRSRGSGAHLGLSLIIDMNIDDYYCSSASSAGVKVLLHNPAEIPLMKSSAFMLPPGVEIRAVFKPVINDATEDFKSIDILKRQCYFTGERYLKYFRTYTTTNCVMECLANITLQKCGCVSFYLPRNASTKICGNMEKACCDNIHYMREVEQTPSKEEQQCHCLPECFQIKYEKSMSYAKFTKFLKVKEDLRGNRSSAYFINNMASFQLYFVNTQFSKFTKSELYRYTDLLSYVGGILGLFLGFGTLSTVELCYHFTLKWLCRALRSKRRILQERKRRQIHLRKTTLFQETDAVTNIY